MYLFFLFLFKPSFCFFNQIKNNIILEDNFFADFEIIDNKNFLGKNFSSDVYLIEKDDILYIVKQSQNNFHFEIEKDFIITSIGNYLIENQNIEGRWNLVMFIIFLHMLSLQLKNIMHLQH